MDVKTMNKKYQEILDLEFEGIVEVKKAKDRIKTEMKILKLYEEMFNEIFEICQKEKIEEMDEFDEKYKKLKFSLWEIIENYINQMDCFCPKDKKILNQRKEVLEKILNQFKLEKEDKIQYEIEIADSIYYLEDEKKATQMLEKIIEENPNETLGYEVKCTWELNKEKPNIEEVAKIIEKADENNVIIENSAIYEKIVEYYNEQGKEEKAEYYQSILNMEQDLYFGEEDDDEFDFENDFLEEDEELVQMQEELQNAMADDLKQVVKNKVSKKKSYEQYLEENQENLINYLSIFIMDRQDEEEAKKIINSKNQKDYILKNKEDIIKRTIINLPKKSSEILEELVKVKYKKIDIDLKFVQSTELVQNYINLINLGLVFGEVRKMSLILHIPEENVILMKQFLEDPKVENKRNEKNKIYSFFKGSVEAYGVIEEKELKTIYKEFFKRNDRDFITDIQIARTIEPEIEIKVDEKQRKIEYIYIQYLEEDGAMKLAKLNPNMKYKKYSLDIYEKLANGKFIEETKGYKEMSKQLKRIYGIFIERDLPELKDVVLEVYIRVRRQDKEMAEKMLEEKALNIFDTSEMFEIPTNHINSKTIKDIIREGFNNIYEELPNWEKKGKIEK